MEARNKDVSYLENDDSTVHELLANVELELRDANVSKEEVGQGIATVCQRKLALEANQRPCSWRDTHTCLGGQVGGQKILPREGASQQCRP